MPRCSPAAHRRPCAPIEECKKPIWARTSHDRAARDRRPARPLRQEPHPPWGASLDQGGRNRQPARAQRLGAIHRSEEHTSELQSRFDLVCRLLLEKKKNKKKKSLM